MRLAALLILSFASFAYGQSEIMPSDWRPDWYVTASQQELDIAEGEALWEVQPRTTQRVLERKAKNIYRDTRGQLWYRFNKKIRGEVFDLWYNLETGTEKEWRPSYMHEDAEPISAQELLGAASLREVQSATYCRMRVKVKDPQYAMRYSHREYNYGNGGEDGSTRRSGGFVDVYRRVQVAPAEYGYEWKPVTQRIRFKKLTDDDRVSRQTD